MHNTPRAAADHADHAGFDDGHPAVNDNSPVVTAGLAPWQDTSLPAKQRVADLLGRMTLDEKVAQLYGVWVDVNTDGNGVAPFQHELADTPIDWSGLITSGLGQLTRPFGTRPIDPAIGAKALAMTQSEIVAANRFGIPAIAHEECLSGFMTWGATVYPTPLAWGASFNPGIVEQMAARTGRAMRDVGVHQGLSPVLDVNRDPRWGRTEETISEDPYLVGTIGKAYIRGLQSAGVIATAKHFVGYSGSRAGRNFAPVAVGSRELADVLLLPFEIAVQEAGVGSVMQAYTEIDGVPLAVDHNLLTELLRDTWGFAGTVVADYFAISFIETLHRVAGTKAAAAGLALSAGIDVELPAVRCYGEPLLAAIRDGNVPEPLIDRAASRVLLQKCELGLLDWDWSPVPPALSDRADSDVVRGTVDLDPPPSRALARELAEESVVLLANDGTLPLSSGLKIALIGPQADNPMAMFGCYTFPSHVGSKHPELPLGIEVKTLLQGLADELPAASIEHVPGCAVDGADTSGIAQAVMAAERADVGVVALGDRSGLFGQGTSGEGCDAADLRLPGVQEELLEALLATGKPIVLVLLAGRPYALGSFADRLAAIVQAFFPGEQGGPAVAGVLSGRVCPSGRLPVGVPRIPGAQPATYLTPPLGQLNEASTVDPTPLYPFGYGLSYTEFEWSDVRVDGVPARADEPVQIGTDGVLSVSVQVRNLGARAGAEVVQLYLHDPVAQVTRPVVRLIGYAKLRLEPGERRRVSFQLHADAAAFTGRCGSRVVEPGDLELRLSASSAHVRHVVPVCLVGAERVVDHRRHLTMGVTVQ